MRWRWITYSLCLFTPLLSAGDAIPWKQREWIYRIVPSFDRFYMNQAFDFGVYGIVWMDGTRCICGL